MRARNVLLALLIIAVGMTITASHRGVFKGWRDAISRLDETATLASVFGLPAGQWQEVESFSRELEADGVRRLNISNVNGEVTVTGQDQDRVRIDVVRHGRGENTGQAIARSREARLQTGRSGDSITVRVTGPKDFWRNARLDLEITAPPNLYVTASSTSGSVSVKRMARDVNGSTVSGDIAVAGAGRADAESASGSIKLHDIRGPVDAHSISGSINAEDIAGEMKLATTTGSIRGTRLEGALTAKTVSGDITLHGYGGSPANLKTTSGGVDVSLSEPLTGELFGHSLSGSITVAFPPGPDCTVDLQSVSGGITLEYAPRQSVHKQFGRVRQVLGAGTGRLELETVSGSVEVTQEAAAPTGRKDGKPEQPAKPSPQTGAERPAQPS